MASSSNDPRAKLRFVVLREVLWQPNKTSGGSNAPVLLPVKIKNQI